MSDEYTVKHPAAGTIQIRDTTKDLKPNPCRDCGRTYMVNASVQVRVPDRPKPVWEGCIDCWVRRTSPEMCATFASPESD